MSKVNRIPPAPSAGASQNEADIGAWLAAPERRGRGGRDEWSHREIEILRQNWGDHIHRHVIVEALEREGFKRTAKACLNKAKELGLPPRNLGTLRRLAKGAVLSEIIPDDKSPLNAHEKVEKMRKCLCCEAQFKSANFGERICLRCKSTREDDTEEFSIVR